MITLKRSTSRYSSAQWRCGSRRNRREHALQAVAQVAAVGQAGQRVVHDLVLELLLDAFALEDLAAQFAGALLHALLELREGALLDLARRGGG